jgi:hypothetical protein
MSKLRGNPTGQSQNKSNDTVLSGIVGVVAPTYRFGELVGRPYVAA